MSTPVNFTELVDACEWVSVAGFCDKAAYVNRESGTVHWVSDAIDADEELPEDIEDIENDIRYLAVPNKHDLDLGRALAMGFVANHLPDSYDTVRGYFHKQGAYARFKNLLERSGCLEAWFQYETDAVAQALREWCEAKGLQVGP